MGLDLIKIEVTPDIAYTIRALAEAGVFAIKTGNASLNFHEGVLKSIKTELMTYPQQNMNKVVDMVVIEPILKV